MKRAAPLVVLGLSTLIAGACDATAPSLTPTTMTGPGVQAGSAGAHAHLGAAVTTGSRPVELRMTPEINQQLAELRQLVAPYHNFEKAVAAGYSVAAPGPGVCISDSVRGGMGFHYTQANHDLINDGVVNLLEPEFLVYAPKENGGVKFAALDYFVPYTTWPHAEPPSLLGIPFAREDGFEAYVLHIWLFWHNPAGMFENFNPAVPLC